MSGYLALALSVGLLAVLDTWLFVVPLAATLPGLVWISFIAWGCHFQSGGGIKGSTTAVVGMSFGALVGMAAVLLAGGGFRHGQHLAFDPNDPPPLCNLYVNMLQRLGIETDRFATSTGTMDGLA